MSELIKNIVGENNEVVIGSFERLENSSISIRGNNNRIIFGEKVWARNFHIKIESSDNVIIVGDEARPAGHIIMKLTDGARIEVGARTSIGGANIICGEGRTVKIGEDCMLSWGIEMRTTDSHAIVDAKTRERINPGADIILGDHVWVGAHATLLKGTVVPPDSIVAIKSLITKAFDEPNVILSGVPAKVIRRGVSWERPLLG